MKANNGWDLRIFIKQFVHYKVPYTCTGLLLFSLYHEGVRVGQTVMKTVLLFSQSVAGVPPLDPFLSQWRNISICKGVTGKNWLASFPHTKVQGIFLYFNISNSQCACWALRRVLWLTCFVPDRYSCFSDCPLHTKSFSPGPSPVDSLFPLPSLCSAFCPLNSFSVRSHYPLGSDSNVGHESVSATLSPAANC